MRSSTPPHRQRLIAALSVTALLGAACTSAPPPTSAPAAATAAAPTVNAVATQVVPTAQAMATQMAPTVQAVATQLAPTAQAMATQMAPAAQSAAATATTAAPLMVTDVKLDRADSTITLHNQGSQAIDLGNTQVRVGSSTATLPANVRVMPGQQITLHTASGTSASNQVFLGDVGGGNLVSALQPGARVEVVGSNGTTLVQFTIPRG